MLIPTGDNRPDFIRRGRIVALATAVAMLAAACATGPAPSSGSGTVARVGTNGGDKPYTINGVQYFPKADPNYDAVGFASWYGADFHGRPTASGEPYNMHAMTAAHATLPFGTKVRVTNLQNGRSAVLTVNDRGPFAQNRIIDVSRSAATKLGFHKGGVARVRVRVMNDYAEAAPAAAEMTPVKAALAEPRPVTESTERFMSVLARAMESERRLEKFPWRDSESGLRGHIIPLTERAESPASDCRNYRRTAEQGSRRKVYVGRACRDAEGSWRVAREDQAGS